MEEIERVDDNNASDSDIEESTERSPFVESAAIVKSLTYVHMSRVMIGVHDEELLVESGP